MKKVLSLISLFYALSSSAQSTITSPQTLVAGRKIHDTTPYKLVFQDDFDGSTLDRTKWRTFHAWKNMIPYDHENWYNARNLNERHSIIRDENVEVTGGKCLLYLKWQTNTWKCDTCDESYRIYRNGTVGIIETYFVDPVTGADMSWSSGKFEARIAFPTHHKTFSAFWLFHNNGYANEIDIVEAFGDPFMPGGLSTFNNRRAIYTTHQWLPFKTQLGSFRYPNQEWWDYVKGRYFDHGAYHTYTCEWDSNRVSFYLDGGYIETLHKYYFPIMIGSIAFKLPAPNTIPVTAAYNVDWGFPWEYPTNTDLKIWNGWGDDPGLRFDYPFKFGNSTVGIDYVKVWQRHPEGGHTDICNQDVPSIVGSSIIPPTGSQLYTVDYPVSGGTWGILGMGGAIVSSTSSACMVSKASGSTKSWFILGYSYTKPGCPTQTIQKKIEVGAPIRTSVIVANVNYQNTSKYYQIAIPYKTQSPTTYTWDISYGNGRSLQTKGQFIATPAFPSSESNTVNWTVTVANSVGTNTFSGSNQNYGGVIVPQSFVEEDEDTVDGYFNAFITDSNAYKLTVDTILSKKYIYDTTDTVGIMSLIQRVRMEELAPYMIYDSVIDSNVQNLYKIAALDTIISHQKSTYKIYPNPTNQIINVQFTGDKSRMSDIYIFDLAGHQVLRDSYSFVPGSEKKIDINELPKGTYLMKVVTPNENKQLFKILKN